MLNFNKPKVCWEIDHERIHIYEPCLHKTKSSHKENLDLCTFHFF